MSLNPFVITLWCVRKGHVPDKGPAWRSGLFRPVKTRMRDQTYDFHHVGIMFPFVLLNLLFVCHRKGDLKMTRA